MDLIVVYHITRKNSNPDASKSYDSTLIFRLANCFLCFYGPTAAGNGEEKSVLEMRRKWPVFISRGAKTQKQKNMMYKSSFIAMHKSA
jgi:hypothetical protein